MGLKLRYNLFHNTAAAAVYGAYVSFYEGCGRPLQIGGRETERIDFHEEHKGWVVVDLDGGWEWKERRDAQLFVSRRLNCSGFLIFVYDGDYWGYEFFDHGQVLDHFVQEAGEAPVSFPGKDCRGRAEVLAEHLPSLRVNDVAPYLVQQHDCVVPEGLNVPARPGDAFRRFDECAALDFLRMLGVHVELRGGCVQLPSPVFRSLFKARAS